jgi:hypothetical protein
MSRLVVCRVQFAGILLVALAQNASAQPPRANGFARLFLVPAATLAQLEEVQKALELTDDQVAELEELNEEMGEQRREAFENGAGDFDKMRKEIVKVYAESHEAVMKALGEKQRPRMQEIYVQINGTNVLQDKQLIEALKLTEEQQEELEQAATSSRQDAFSFFQEARDMSEEERAEEIEALVKDRDEAMLGVLDEEQKKEFEKLKGEKLEVDLSKLPGPGRN